MKREVVFDVETKKLFSDITTDNPGDLGVSIVSVYQRIVDEQGKEMEGTMMSFWEKDFSSMWEIFENAERIIGFNSKYFDVPALEPYYKKGFAKLPHFDLMDSVKEKIGRKLSLNALTEMNIGSSKTDVGTNAVLYFARGDPESLQKLQHYCEADVAITRDLYDFGKKEHQFQYRDKWNGISKFSVDFSYPVPKSDPQIGLF